jgi:hypothetical protein
MTRHTDRAVDLAHDMDMLQRLVRVEEAQERAHEEREKMSKVLSDVSTAVTKLVHQQEVRDAKFGGILWAASAMATAAVTVIKLIWEWLHKGG